MKLSEGVVDRAIGETQKETGTVTVDRFRKEVESRVSEQKNRIRDLLGDSSKEVEAEIDKTTQEWGGRLKQYVGDDHVGDTEDIGAAGYVDIASKKMVLSKEGTNLNVDDSGYRERVVEHEKVHQEDQASSFTQQDVRYIDDSGSLQTASVIGDLTERQAIVGADQPDTDLVPEYIKHREIGDEVASIAGEGVMNEALKSGDINRLQEEIFRRQQEEMMQLLNQPHPSLN